MPEQVRTVRFVRSAAGPEGFPRDGLPQVAFAGRSNVGKSSLLNRLVGRRRLARTSGTPGCTQTVNLFLVNERLYLVDLPGFGYARASRARRKAWGGIVEAYLERSPPRLVVLLVDGQIGGTGLDTQAWAFLADRGLSPLVAATKMDRVPRSRRPAAMAAVRTTLGLPPESPVLALSARSGEGVPELWRAVEACL